jgi:hypothetical protein
MRCSPSIGANVGSVGLSRGSIRRLMGCIALERHAQCQQLDRGSPECSRHLLERGLGTTVSARSRRHGVWHVSLNYESCAVVRRPVLCTASASVWDWPWVK